MQKILAGALVCACLSTTALAVDFSKPAEALHNLGLLQGTTTAQGTVDYALDDPCTRAEAAVMLVRLLGKETEAKTQNNPSPFTDLYEWQKPYVGWLYENGLTTGTSATTFEPEVRCTTQMYASFVLRALGYGTSDFTYENALTVAAQKGVYHTAYMSDFLRDDAIAMSYLALLQQHKSTSAEDSITLLEDLVNSKAVTMAQAEIFQSQYEQGQSGWTAYNKLQQVGSTAQVTYAYKQDTTMLSIHGDLQTSEDGLYFEGTLSVSLGSRRAQTMEIVLAKNSWWQMKTYPSTARYTTTEVANVLRESGFTDLLQGEILQDALLQAVATDANGTSTATVGDTTLTISQQEQAMSFTAQVVTADGAQWQGAVTNLTAAEEGMELPTISSAVRL